MTVSKMLIDAAAKIRCQTNIIELLPAIEGINTVIAFDNIGDLLAVLVEHFTVDPLQMTNDNRSTFSFYFLLGHFSITLTHLLQLRLKKRRFWAEMRDFQGKRLKPSVTFFGLWISYAGNIMLLSYTS